MKKKLVSILLTAALAGTMLAGCGGSAEVAETGQKGQEVSDQGGSEEVSKETSGDPVEISMFIASPEYADAIGELIEAYKEVKPNVTINYETTQNDYPTLLKAKLNSGECPDIFSSTSGKEIGVYLDYSLNLADQPLAEVMSAPVKAAMMSGEEVHGMSIKGNYFGMIYNKEAFDKAGIASFPQTFSEMEKACEALKTAGYTPFTTGYGEWWVFKHVFQHFMAEAQPDDVEGLVKAFVSGEAHIKDYPALYEDYFRFIDLTLKYGDAKPLETDLSGQEAAFAAGKAAMVVGQGAWVEADILKINPDIQIGFDGYPVCEDASKCKVIAGSDQALRVNKDSAVLQETLDFLNWWYTSDYGKAWFCDVAGVIPPIDGASSPDFEIIKQGNALVEAEGADTLGIIYSTDSFHQAFGEVMQGYVAGTKDKDTVCAEIEEKWMSLEK